MTSWQDKAATMPSRPEYKHKFVDNLPDKLEDGILYICIQYATSAHNCFCGCKREVVTPIHPTKWQLTFDGISVSLYPSIGNWSLPCRSHYWLRNGRVSWADSWSDDKIAAARSRDVDDQEMYFGKPEASSTAVKPSKPETGSFWRWLANRFGGR